MKKQPSKVNLLSASKVCRIILLIEIALIVVLRLVWDSAVSNRISYVLIGQCYILLILAIGLYHRGKRQQ